MSWDSRRLGLHAAGADNNAVWQFRDGGCWCVCSCPLSALWLHDAGVLYVYSTAPRDCQLRLKANVSTIWIDWVKLQILRLKSTQYWHIDLWQLLSVMFCMEGFWLAPYIFRVIQFLGRFDLLLLLHLKSNFFFRLLLRRLFPLSIFF